MSRLMKSLSLFGVLCGVALVVASPALAHARVELGPYVVIVGWQNEPVIVGERNALVVEVSDEDGAPVEGLESSLDVEVLYAGRTFSGNFSPTPEPGLYTIDMFPTVRGQYTVHLEGSIGEMAVDEMIEPEEVLPAAVLEFPETQPGRAELQEEIDALEARLQTATLLAVAGVALGVVGTGVGIVGVVRGRSKAE